MAEERIVAIDFIEIGNLPIEQQMELGRSRGFAEIKRVRNSPLRTELRAITGLPSDELINHINESEFNSKPLITIEEE